MRLLKKTMSVCPDDLKPIEAELWEVEGQVVMRKRCPEHGRFEDLYWSDAEEYLRAERFRDDGSGTCTPRESDLDCPRGCGICDRHTTGTTLLMIDVTNRCNLKCPICFAAVRSRDHRYEPPLPQIRAIVEHAQRVNRPNTVQGVLNSGGEPTVRDDLFDILEMERSLGIDYLIVATNGLRLAEEIGYLRRLRDLGVYTYLQFDGVTPEPYRKARGRDLWPVKQQVIANARKIGYDRLVLVPTIARGVNDHQIGDMIRYIAENSDVIRHAVFQPVSFAGRIDRRKLKQMRITTPDVMRLIEEQTRGELLKSDFFTLPMSQTLAKIAAQGRKHRDFCVHPHCGVVALVAEDHGRLHPVSRFIDNDKLYERMRSAFDRKSSRPRILWELATGLALHAKPQIWPGLMPLLRAPRRQFGQGFLVDWMRSHWITIGIMQFMDPYNFDLDRVRRCGLHYGVPDRETGARLIPFCAMNNFHRQAVEREFSTAVGPEAPEPVPPECRP